MAPLAGTVVTCWPVPGDAVWRADRRHPRVDEDGARGGRAPSDRVRQGWLSAAGDTVAAGRRLVSIEDGHVEDGHGERRAASRWPAVRADLAEVLDRQARHWTRPVPRRSPNATADGHRTARENLDDLCDPGSSSSTGPGGGRPARPAVLEDLLQNTRPTASSAARPGSNGAAVVVVSYDYMVLAGTQGYHGHRKKDRLFELAERYRLPVVLFAEGGGGRPGDTAAPEVSGLEVMAFALFGRLSGLVPLVGVVSGRCFAGNAALLGCCDVIIATEDSSIGMAGPAMIEGGGLGRFHPDEVGPVSVQAANGVIDVLVADEAAAVAAAKQYLGYFQGRWRTGTCADQQLLRAPSRRTGSGSTTSARSSPGWPTPIRFWSCGPVGRRDRHRAAPARGPPGRDDRQQPGPSRRRHRLRRSRQGGPLPAAV